MLSLFSRRGVESSIWARKESRAPNNFSENEVIRVCGRSHLGARRWLARSRAATGGGAPWHRIPELLRHPPVSSAPLLAKVPADAHDSTLYAERELPPTLSTSVASFAACCTLFGPRPRPHPSVSRGSLSLETTAPDVRELRTSCVPSRTRHSRSEHQRYRSCAPRTGHFPGSCIGQRPQHLGPTYLSSLNGLRPQLSLLQHEPQGFPDVRPWQREHIPHADKSPEIQELQDPDPKRCLAAGPSSRLASALDLTVESRCSVSLAWPAAIVRGYRSTPDLARCRTLLALRARSEGPQKLLCGPGWRFAAPVRSGCCSRPD